MNRALRLSTPFLLLLLSQACLNADPDALVGTALDQLPVKRPVVLSGGLVHSDDALLDESMDAFPTVFASVRGKGRRIAYPDTLELRRKASTREPMISLNAETSDTDMPASLSFSANLVASFEIKVLLRNEEYQLRDARKRTLRFTAIGAPAPVFYNQPENVMELDFTRHLPHLALEPVLYLSDEGLAWIEEILENENTFKGKLKVEICQEMKGWIRANDGSRKLESTKHSVCVRSNVLDELFNLH
ncbi:MAG TPA: hypothetical protein VM901_11940 [Bdellovibrionota bacterium]|jgi:hypothetical protein|nr:hypothetical protein [Bdellovibrionota bacterium]